MSDTAIPSRLWNRNFTLLWQGQLVSKLGSQAHSVAIMLWIKQATDSATVMGAVVMAASLPAMLVAPFAGVMADRFSRRGIMIFSDLASGLAVFSLALFMFAAPHATTPALVWMFVVSVVLSLTMISLGTAGSAAVPDLVPRERLAGANAASRLSDQVAGFLGQGVGGVLFRILGAPLLFLFDSLSYLYAAAATCFVRIPQAPPANPEPGRTAWQSLKADLAEGFRFVWHNPGIRTMFLFASVLNFFFSPLTVLLPFYVEDTLHASPDWFGYLIAALGLGTAFGYGLAAWLKGSGNLRAILALSAMVLLSTGFMTLGLVDRIGPAVVVILMTGFFLGIANVITVTALQKAVPSEIRGRVFGLLSTLVGGLVPIAQGLTGIVADACNQNSPAIFIGCGAATILFSSLLALNRPFRQFLATS